jgi:hypothetical protein
MADNPPPISPKWFTIQCMKHKGDLYKIFHGCHKNYSLSSLIAMYTKVKRVCPQLPKLVLKNEEFESLPEEHKSDINNLLADKKVQQNWIENFSNHRQQTEKLRNKRFGKK